MVYRLNEFAFFAFLFMGCTMGDKAVTVRNTPPIVTIETPEEGDTLNTSAPIEFVANVEDAESSPEELSLEWSSDVQGLLDEGRKAGSDGSATWVTSVLTDGDHVITLKVRDPRGLTGTDYVSVTIENGCTPTEELENGLDDDCDGIVDEGTAAYDDDGDGFTENDGDCDDSDEGINPEAEEILNDRDEDCDGLVDEGTTGFDDDGDGQTELEGDCDDENPSIYTGAEEVVDGLDQDCDGEIDEDTSASDDDGDGFNELEGDCDDADPSVYPGADEIVDGIDQDCNDLIDDETDAYDDDGDGFSEDDGDCDDDNSAIHPDAEEVANGFDDDCDGLIDEGSTGYDDDGDGFSELEGDCDDGDATINPDAEEVCDGIDNDCDSYIDAEDDDTDEDDDGYSSCEGDEQDCDDSDPDIHPDADELCGDEIDNDCDGDIDAADDETDMDGDGYSSCDLDCNDSNPEVYSGAVERCSTPFDDDCDGDVNDEGAEGSDRWYRDDDEDGYGHETDYRMHCEAYGAYNELDNDDCDDENALVNPAAEERCLTAYDDNCNGDVNDEGALGSFAHYADRDGDGYGDEEDSKLYCDEKGFYSTVNNEDCDDELSAVNPGATERCSTPYDDNCDGDTNDLEAEGSVEWYRDEDGDGYGHKTWFEKRCVAEGLFTEDDATDCCDLSYYTNPGAGGSLSSANECGDYDMDCDGVETLMWNDDWAYECEVDYVVLVDAWCEYEQGWVYFIPACGVDQTWADGCDFYDDDDSFWDIDWVCTSYGHRSTRTQLCS